MREVPVEPREVPGVLVPLGDDPVVERLDRGIVGAVVNGPEDPFIVVLAVVAAEYRLLGVQKGCDGIGIIMEDFCAPGVSVFENDQPVAKKNFDIVNPDV